MSVRRHYYRLATLLWNSGLALPGADDGTSISIVCFHGVHSAEMASQAPPPTSSVATSSFEADIGRLTKQYQVIELSQAMQMLAGERPFRPKCAVITFDDSLKCIFTLALPTLTRIGISATLFVSTEIIETQQPYWWLRLEYAWHHGVRRQAVVTLPNDSSYVVDREDRGSMARLKSVFRGTPAIVRDGLVSDLEEQLGASLSSDTSRYQFAEVPSWSDLRDAVNAGFAVGSHTVTHPNLTLLSPDDVRYELIHSKQTIERRLNVTCKSLCYPYGAHNSEVARIAAAAGYEAAVTTVPGRNRRGDPSFFLKRYSASSAEDKLSFVMSGAPQRLR